MRSSPLTWKDGQIMPPLDGDTLDDHDAQRYMLKFTGGSVDHEFVLAGDYDSLLRELARCQARIGELEFINQNLRERVALKEGA